MGPLAHSADVEDEIAVYHGGDLGAARQQFPNAPTPWLDLSTGINPVPYPVEMISAPALSRLPDSAAVGSLQDAAAGAYGAKKAEQIVCTPGSQAAIQWLPRLINAHRVAILGFGYQEYPALWRAAGADVLVTPHLELLTKPGIDLAIVVNPNNPDGRLVDPQTLADIAAQMAERGGLLVVDEAFMDVTRTGASLVPHLPGRGALVLRSFGKTYGLAGLRLGFAIASADLAAQLRAAFGPWAISGAAIEIGVAALNDRNWLAQAVTRLEADAARLDGLLMEAGFDILGGTPLFRLASHRQAAQWFEAMARQGILVRPFRERNDWLRFGLPASETDWARLAEALCTRQPAPAMT